MADDGSVFYTSRLDRLLDGGVTLLSAISFQLATWLLVGNGIGAALLFSGHARTIHQSAVYAAFLVGLVFALGSIAWTILGGSRIHGRLRQLRIDIEQSEECERLKEHLALNGLPEGPELHKLDREATERMREFYTHSRQAWRLMVGPNIFNLLSGAALIGGLAIPLLTGGFEPVEVPAAGDSKPAR